MRFSFYSTILAYFINIIYFKVIIYLFIHFCAYSSFTFCAELATLIISFICLHTDMRANLHIILINNIGDFQLSAEILLCIIYLLYSMVSLFLLLQFCLIFCFTNIYKQLLIGVLMGYLSKCDDL